MENLVSLPDTGFIKKAGWKNFPGYEHFWKKVLGGWYEQGDSRVPFFDRQPLVYRKNGKLVAEYPDGRIKTV